MYILSQDKTRIYNMSGHIEGIGYEESKDYKQRKSENIRHTIQVFDGRAEEIAEFKTKEDCMLVIYAIFKGMEQDSKAVEIPTQEEMEKQKDLIKQLAEAGQEVAAGIEDLLKEMKSDEFQKKLTSWVEKLDIKVNNKAIKRYTPKVVYDKQTEYYSKNNNS